MGGVKRRQAAVRGLSGDLIGHSDATRTIDHLPTVPTCEEKDEHDQQQQDYACRKHSNISVLIALVPAVNLD